MGRVLFSERFPAFYSLAQKKEIVRRHIKDCFSSEKIAATRSAVPLPNVVTAHSSILIRRLAGVDLTLQENKVTNILLACKKINGLVIRPGETFSFWRTVGRPGAENGYKEGLVISGGHVGSGVGGGLCQMGNLIHWMVLNSPLQVTELHHHSDAFFPDERRRVPFGTGTSVMYNSVDYRFKNTAAQDVQLLVWVQDGELCGELRSERPFHCRYALVEENSHFRPEGDDYYRISQVCRLVISKATGAVLRKELILDNHSRVIYDHSLIPPEQIRRE